MVIKLGVRSYMVDFALNSVARSVGVSRYTCLSTSQEIVWDERLRCDLFSVEWNVKP